MINVFEPCVGNGELKALGEVLAARWLGGGSRVDAFEQAFASTVGARRHEVLAVTSCTEGLFQAIAALGLGPQDEIILPSISFVGAAHAAQDCGAQVVLCDVDPTTLMPTVDHISCALTPRTRAVVVLHYGGHPGDIRSIVDLARAHSVVVVEDAACGLGSSEAGIACGMFGDIGVWSFDAMKIVTCGDGGMVRARSADMMARIRERVSLGVGSSGFGRSSSGKRWWEVDPTGVGRRGRMNDVSAAIGLVQLARLPEFRRRRAAVATIYNRSFAELQWVSRPPEYPRTAARHFYWIQLAPPLRDQLACHLLTRDIYTTFRYWPLHRTSMYAAPGPFPGAESAAASTLLLPLHQGLSHADVSRVVEAVSTFRP